MENFNIIDLNPPKNDVVKIYYPNGKLIVETDNTELMNYVRCQIYENDIVGCYAESGDKHIELNGRNNWPFSNNNLEMLARLVREKGKFMRRHPEFE